VDGDHTSLAEETVGWSRGRRVGIALAAVFAVALVSLLMIGLLKGEPGQLIDQKIARGERVPAPDFTLPVLAAGGGIGPVGSMVSLNSLKGKPVIVNLWASWCPPCQEEAPILQRIWERNRAKGVTVLGVDTEDGSDAARKFIAEFGLTFPSVRDGSDGTKKKFETGQLPETFVIDAQGRLVQTIRGGLNTAAEKAINEFLDSEPAS
jgi:cytochrome c biogenesis protein CcmG, thiol:disulfide interchange protein DsbE